MISIATLRVDYANTTRRGVCAAAAARRRTALRARSGHAAAASATATAAPPVPLRAAYNRSYYSATAGPQLVPSEYPLAKGEGYHGRCAGPIQQDSRM